jgi:hypothetical protein
MSFERHVYAVQCYVGPNYAPLLKPEVATHPICSFGNPARARRVTVGVDPSVGEFENERWSAVTVY